MREKNKHTYGIRINGKIMQKKIHKAKFKKRKIKRYKK
jgi:hypothetical protein